MELSVTISPMMNFYDWMSDWKIKDNAIETNAYVCFFTIERKAYWHLRRATHALGRSVDDFHRVKMKDSIGR
jgi:hypothetical protein